MRPRKLAAIFYTLSILLTGVGTTAKSANIENTLTAIHKKYQPETLNDLEKDKQDEIICAALNLYHEGRGTTKADIMAIGFSTRNRVAKSSLKSFCGTIWERGQYEWTKRPVSGILPKEKDSWIKMVDYARQIVLQDDLIDTTHGADSFYCKKLHPKWAKRSHIHVIIGPHCFVRLLGI